MYIYKVINIENLSDEEFNNCLPLLSPDRRERVDRLKSVLPKKLSVAGDLLARRLAAELMGRAEPDRLLIKCDERGKPYIEGCAVNISISHSGSYALAAASYTSVGADIERVRPLKKNIAAHFLSGSEMDYVSFDETQYENRLIKLWTMKEAFGKMTGDGVFKNSRFGALFANGELLTDYDTCSFSFPKAPEGYVICVCSKRAYIETNL
jgi:phosphopantetheine--protein transferase-like protein